MPLVSLLLTTFAPQAIPPRMTQEPATHEREAVIKGRGSLTVKGEALEFEATSLKTGSHPQLGKIYKLAGCLTPQGGPAWTLELQLTEKGQLLMMQFFRKEKDQETGRWSATLNTKVEVLATPHDQGGALRLKCTGPLSGMLHGKPMHAAWTGEIAAFLQ